MDMLQEIRTCVIMALPLILQLVGLTFAVRIDPYIVRKRRRMMFLIIAADFSLIAQNLAGYMLDVRGIYPYERTLVGIFGYCVRPLILLLFFYIVSEKERHTTAWILIAVNTGVHLTALFSGICFRIDENDAFQRGPLGYTCHIVSAILLAYLVCLTMREHGSVRRLEAWIPIFNALMIIGSVVLDSAVFYQNYPVNFLTMAVVSGSVFYYVWLHLQFVREHENALMAEQRIQIMMTQIQPHFLYNTLSTIQALCRIDPEKAFSTTEKFGTYLRQNLDSLDQTYLIPVAKELEHTKIYADIEMIRFPRIRMRYRIEDEDFSLPALSVQPLVENAIRHGVRARKNGLVSIVTRREAKYHEIVIRDNGVGFDTEAAGRSDGTHIGIRNVRERIERMCGGTLTVESRAGEGTTATIRIP